MRREGYIIEEIIEYSNMSEAFDAVLRGTDRKRSTQGRYLLAHREQVIVKLTEAIASGSFQLGGYHEREIEEYGKKRTLQILSMYDRGLSTQRHTHLAVGGFRVLAPKPYLHVSMYTAFH